MISSEVLEKPGKWRSLVLVTSCLLALIPAFPLIGTIFSDASTPIQSVLKNGFGMAILHSLTVAIAVSVLAIFFGMPAGILAGLYDFTGRKPLLALLAIPLLVPSFLWAIGLSQLRIHLGLQPECFLSGWTGTILAFAAPALSLVLYMTLVCVKGLSKSQLESVRLVGGEPLLFYYVMRAVFYSAALTGALAGMITLSDPGPGQILGFAGVSYEILLSFSALYDFSLAAQQCLLLTGVVLFISIPLAVFMAPNVATGLLGRDIGKSTLTKSKAAGALGFTTLGGITLFTMVIPISGIVQPLLTNFPWARAWQEVSRTARDTLIYALSAGFMATVFGFFLAISVGRQRSLRRYAWIGFFLMLSLPPSLSALGIIKISTAAPSMFDPLLRSRFTVALALALRFFPMATILAMRSFGSSSPSQALVASVHGVPLSLYFRRVLGPLLLPSATLSCMIIALLATADVGTVLLLRPPGADSLPVQIFTVMANAPESLVAALCFAYIGSAALLLVIGWSLTGKGNGV